MAGDFLRDMSETKQWVMVKRWLAAMLLVGGCVIAIRIWLFPGGLTGRTDSSRLSSSDAAANNTPPWGHLERQRITIERPKAFVSLSHGFALQKAWFFGGIQPDKLEAFLRGMPLPPKIQAHLLDRSKWKVETQSI